MKTIAVFAVVLAVALAAPQQYQHEKDATIVRLENDNIGVDGYNYAYETSDGKVAEEQGKVVNAGTDQESLAVRGHFQYTGPDGVVYAVSYVADENGFQPQGEHLNH